MTSSRSNPGRPLRVLVALACAAASTSQAGDACSCVPPPPPDVAFDRSDAVFTATAVDVPTYPGKASLLKYEALNAIDETLGTDFANPYWTRPVVFEVDASWKGVEATRTVITGGGSTCDFSFAEGHRYLIYARLWEGNLQTGICTRTGEVHRVQEDLDALAMRTQLRLSDLRPMPPLLIVLAVAVLAGGLVVALRLWGRPASAAH